MQKPTVFICSLGTAHDAQHWLDEAERARAKAATAPTTPLAEFWLQRADACTANAIAAAS